MKFPEKTVANEVLYFVETFFIFLLVSTALIMGIVITLQTVLWLCLHIAASALCMALLVTSIVIPWSILKQSVPFSFVISFVILGTFQTLTTITLNGIVICVVASVVAALLATILLELWGSGGYQV